MLRGSRRRHRWTLAKETDAIRVAMMTDSADDIPSIARRIAALGHELVAVLVPMRVYELARFLAPDGTRCATHPGELASVAIDVWVTAGRDGRLGRAPALPVPARHA
mgnify:CR=1 FL=1